MEGNKISGELRKYYKVEKANSLVDMKNMPYNIHELKLLDIYLSRINARDPEATEVEFLKKDYEQLMGIDYIKPNVLNKHVVNLTSKVVVVPIRNENDDIIGWENFPLFSRSKCYLEDNRWKVVLDCSLDAKKLFFNLENIKYVHYEVQSVLTMKSMDTILLSLYILKCVNERNNKNRIVTEFTWSENIADLKHNVFKKPKDNGEGGYKEFNRSVLKKAITELNDSPTFGYAISINIQRGTDKKAQTVVFKVTNKSPQLLQTRFKASDYAEACDNEFSETQVQGLLQYICKIVPSEKQYSDLDWCRYEYLQNKYIDFAAKTEDREDIESRYAYFASIIKSDADRGYIYEEK